MIIINNLAQPLVSSTKHPNNNHPLQPQAGRYDKDRLQIAHFFHVHTSKSATPSQFGCQ